MIKKVVVIGPESTGKSTLSKQLSDHFDTIWIPEYAREYLEANGMDYKYEDLLTIAKGQLELEDDLMPHAENGLAFIDTNMYVMKVWSEFVFRKLDPFITEQIKNRRYDLYLLCNVDLPWVKDELREYPDVEIRKNLFEIYKELMENQSVPWVEISGNYDERFAKALNAVNALMSGKFDSASAN